VTATPTYAGDLTVGVKCYAEVYL